MIATGVRIGEALAVCWPDVDLDVGAVRIEHTIIRMTGVGLLGQSLRRWRVQLQVDQGQLPADAIPGGDRT